MGFTVDIPVASDKIEADKPMTPLPVSQVIGSMLIQMCEAANVNVLFPFLAFMVEDFGYRGEKLGYYAGGLAAAFCAAQFCSSVPWGLFSDYFGRKPAVIFGTLGAGVGMMVFGLAKTFPQAVIGRMISGFLSGNLGVLKSYVTEVTDETNRGLGFSYLSAAWTIGTIIAPLAGGLLCSPAYKYPSIFSQNGIFAEYPYFLPCLFCVFLNIFSSVICFFTMTETKTFDIDIIKSEINDKMSHESIEAGHKRLEVDGKAAIEASKLVKAEKKPVEKVIEKEKSSGSILMERVVLLVTIDYGVLSAAAILLDETIPLYLKLDVDEGGFSYDSTDIGLILSVSGIFIFYFSVYYLPVLSLKSKFWMMDIGAKASMINTLTWPFLAYLNTYLLKHVGKGFYINSFIWMSLMLSNVSRHIWNSMCFTAVMIQLNNSVEEEHLGIVNGLGQSFGALARAIGPALGGVLWSVSLQMNLVLFNFVGVSIIFALTLGINKMLPPSLDFKNSGKKG